MSLDHADPSRAAPQPGSTGVPTAPVVPALPALPTLPPVVPQAPQPAIVPPAAVPGGVTFGPNGLPQVDFAARNAERARQRKRRRRIGRVILLVIFAVLGTIGVFGYRGLRDYQAEQRLPAAPTAPLANRSATLDETSVRDGSSFATTVRVDVAGRAFHLRPGGRASPEMIVAGGYIYLLESTTWERLPTSPELETAQDVVFVRADGFTIDEALPVPAREYVVDDGTVKREIVDGHDVRRFDFVIDNDGLRADPVASAAMKATWGERDDSRPSSQNGQPIRYMNLTLWVDDDGWVWKWESRSSDGADLLSGTVTVSDEQFVPPVPAVYTDRTAPVPTAEILPADGTVPPTAPPTVPPVSIPPLVTVPMPPQVRPAP